MLYFIHIAVSRNTDIWKEHFNIVLKSIVFECYRSGGLSKLLVRRKTGSRILFSLRMILVVVFLLATFRPQWCVLIRWSKAKMRLASVRVVSIHHRTGFVSNWLLIFIFLYKNKKFTVTGCGCKSFVLDESSELNRLFPLASKAVVRFPFFVW